MVDSRTDRKVKQRTGWTPSKSDPHWKRIPSGGDGHPASGFAIRWKLPKRVNIPYRKRFPQLGWEQLADQRVAAVRKLDSADLYDEGKRVLRTHLAVERDPKLRANSKEHWRAKLGGRLCCIACRFDFEKRYGPCGVDFIEIHHTAALGTSIQTVRRRVIDLVPVCSNCHRMLHKDPKSLLSIVSLRRIMNGRRG